MSLLNAARRVISLLEGRSYTYDIVDVKRWVAEPDACEICQDNEDDGWIGDDEVFSSGDDSPPAHPHCKCEIEYGEKRKRVYD